HFEPKFARRFDGLHGRRSRGAHVVHNHHPCALFAETFDALACAVLLLRLTHEETVQGSAGYRDGYDNGIGTHRKSADGVGVPTPTAHFIEKNLADQL